MNRLAIIALLLSILISTTGCKSSPSSHQNKKEINDNSTVKKLYDSPLNKSEKENEEMFQSAKLIIYCKSYIKGDKYVPVFDKVLWGALENIPGLEMGALENMPILEMATQEIDLNYYRRYYDGLIYFYTSKGQTAWPVSQGRLPYWRYKKISEFIEFLKEHN